MMKRARIVTALLKVIFDEEPSHNAQKNLPVCCAKHLNELREVIIGDYMDEVETIATEYIRLTNNRLVVTANTNNHLATLAVLDAEISALPRNERPAVYCIEVLAESMGLNIMSAMSRMPPKVASDLANAMRDGRVRFITEEDMESMDKSDMEVLFDNDSTTVIARDDAPNKTRH